MKTNKFIETLKSNRSNHAKWLLEQRRKRGHIIAADKHKQARQKYTLSDRIFLCRPTIKDLTELFYEVDRAMITLGGLDTSDLPCGLQDYYNDEYIELKCVHDNILIALAHLNNAVVKNMKSIVVCNKKYTLIDDNSGYIFKYSLAKMYTTGEYHANIHSIENFKEGTPPKTGPFTCLDTTCAEVIIAMHHEIKII